MAKASKSTIQTFSLNDVEYEDETEAPEEQYELVEAQTDPLDAIDFDDEPQNIKVEPDGDFEYMEDPQDDNEDENAEYVITEINDPSAYSNIVDLQPVDPEPSSSKYVCNVCGKCFQYLRSYNQHRLTHALRTDVTECEICHKELKRTALEYHMKYRHIDARNYKCEVCLNRFKSPGALRHHIATFHPREGYDCDECERVFKTRFFLNKHKEEVHVFKPIVIEKFDCQYCNKVFKNQGQLTLHIGIMGKKLGKCRDTLNS
jgi:hypothetical protein